MVKLGIKTTSAFLLNMRTRDLNSALSDRVGV